MYLIRASFLLIVLIGLTHCTFEPEVSQWRGPDRNGIYPATNLLKVWPEGGPELLWKFDQLGIGHASASVISDRVFTAGTIDSITFIYSFDMEGNLLWKKEIGPEWMKNYPGVRSTPLIYGELGYFLNGLGKIICFKIDDGSIVWARELFTEFDGRNITWGITENLIIDGNTLFCVPGGIEANIAALDRYTGETIWISKGDGKKSGYSSPKIIQIKDKKFLISMMAGSVVSINTENGELAWKHPLLNEHDSHANIPIIRNDTLFLIPGYQDSILMVKISEDGCGIEKIWRNDILNLGMGDAVLIGDYIYSGASLDGKLHTIDWKTGNEIYSKEMYSFGRLPGCTIISADGMLYCYGFSGRLDLIKPTESGFDVISSIQIGAEKIDHWAHPVIKDGRLYVRYDTTLYVYNISNT